MVLIIVNALRLCKMHFQIYCYCYYYYYYYYYYHHYYYFYHHHHHDHHHHLCKRYRVFRFQSLA